MAQFDITSPDGKKFRVTAPDGATQEQVLAYAQEQFAKQAPLEKQPGMVEVAIPVAGAATSLATGAVGGVAGGLAGLGSIATNALGLTNTPPGDVVRNVSGALTYEPRTAGGRAITGAISYPFEKLAELGDVAGGRVTDVTGSPVLGAGANTAIQSLPMLVSPAARALPGESAASIASRARAQTLNAPLESQVAAARGSGLKVTPQEANAGPISRGIASIAGEPRLAKLASKKNAPTINDMIRRDVGLPEDVPLSREALAQIRKEEGAAYEAVKNVGRFGTDSKYSADLNAITKGFDTAAKDFAHRQKNPVQETVDGLRVKSMDAASAVEEVKNLRADADKAYRQGDKQLGKAYKDAAQALDDQLERHLQRHAGAVGDPKSSEAVSNYRAARQRIAKTYAADKALNDKTGNIDAAIYAAERGKGVPLSGEAKNVADFATAFPRSTQRSERLGATGPTRFDLLVGGIGGILGGSLGGAPGAAGLVLGAGAPVARSALLSGPGQRIITSPRSYGQPGLRTLQDILREIGEEAAITGVAAGQ